MNGAREASSTRPGARACLKVSAVVVRNARKGPSSVRLVTLAIIAANISPPHARLRFRQARKPPLARSSGGRIPAPVRSPRSGRVHRRPSDYEFTKAGLRVPTQPSRNRKENHQRRPGVSPFAMFTVRHFLSLRFQIVKAPSGHRARLNAVNAPARPASMPGGYSPWRSTGPTSYAFNLPPAVGSWCRGGSRNPSRSGRVSKPAAPRLPCLRRSSPFRRRSGP